MKETGIIMSGDHPRKILDGTETMTRRVIKPQPPATLLNPTLLARDPASPSGYSFISDEYGEIQIKCPYGQVGDRLWVRETWMHRSIPSITKPQSPDSIYYKATNPEVGEAFIWKPSIHMPRWASRITLEITEEKAARTQDLTLAEAIAEGYSSIEEANKEFLKLAHLPEDANPWDWVIGFKVIK